VAALQCVVLLAKPCPGLRPRWPVSRLPERRFQRCDARSYPRRAV